MSDRTDNGYDAVVIGAGHNGLVAAATLAGKGKRVVVLERHDHVGGMAATTEIAPGVTASRIAHLLFNLNPLVMRDLNLDVNADPISGRKVQTVCLSPDGRHVVVGKDAPRFADGSPHPDADRYLKLRDRLVRFAAVLAPLLNASPPQSGDWSLGGVRELGGLAKTGLDLRRLGKTDMREFLRIALSNAYDLILDELPDGPLAGSLAVDAVLGGKYGPRSPGTVLSLMQRMVHGGERMLPAGGMGGVCAAMANTARNRGVEIRTGCDVTGILVADDRARGVALADGSEVRSKIVLSNLDAPGTVHLAGVGHFDVEMCRRVRNIRNKGATAKINLVLSGMPSFTGLDEKQVAERLIVSPTVDYAERASNPLKYGKLSDAPVIEAVLPERSGSAQILSAVVQYVPYEPDGGWRKAAREMLARTTLDTLSRYAPGISDLVEKADVLTPADIEEISGTSGGHWHHGETCVDQMLTLRPANGMSRYATGLPGLYLCGAAAHPGGDVTGSPGRNSALQALRDGGMS